MSLNSWFSIIQECAFRFEIQQRKNFHLFTHTYKDHGIKAKVIWTGKKMPDLEIKQKQIISLQDCLSWSDKLTYAHKKTLKWQFTIA